MLAAIQRTQRQKDSRSSAFTLIEIMVVVGLIGIFLVVGIPAFVMMREKADLEQSVDYLLTACATARTQAILTGKPHDLIFNSVDRTLSVVIATGEMSENDMLESTDENDSAAPAPQRTVWRFPEEVSLEVNALTEDEDGTVFQCRFYPNAICDDFEMVLSDSSGEYSIILEATTGQPMVTNLSDR